MIKTACVYCASSSKVDISYIKAAEKLGEILAKKNIKTIFGAGKEGLMGALAKGVLENKGEIIGVLPQFMYERKWYHEYLTDLILTKDMHERKKIMLQQADVIVALPGGIGTLEELVEAITWKQLGLIQKDIIIININKYFNPLLAVLKQAIDEKFMQKSDTHLWKVIDGVEEIQNI